LLAGYARSAAAYTSGAVSGLELPPRPRAQRGRGKCGPQSPVQL